MMPGGDEYISQPFTCRVACAIPEVPERKPSAAALIHAMRPDFGINIGVVPDGYFGMTALRPGSCSFGAIISRPMSR
jgi:hypothetical protein